MVGYGKRRARQRLKNKRIQRRNNITQQKILNKEQFRAGMLARQSFELYDPNQTSPWKEGWLHADKQEN